MFVFGLRSQRLLSTCHPQLIALGEAAIAASRYDFACTEGHRSEAIQKEMRRKGLSKVETSKHQSSPSLAVHFEPWPILYPNIGGPLMQTVKRYARFYMLGVHILHIADDLGLQIRWGADWNQNNDILDQTFDDLAHFELVL